MSAGSRRDRVAAELKRIRTDLDLPGESVAAALGWSQSKVSRIETGRISVSVSDLAELLHYYGVPPDIRSELLATTAADIGLNGAWAVRAGGRTRRQSQVADIESQLKSFRQYQALLVPGQIQSEAYALDHLIRIGSKDAKAIASRRMRRQAILEGDGAPKYECVLDARALLPCSEDMLPGLISHIQARASLPNVHIRVLPLGADAGRAFVPFLIYNFQAVDSSPIVLIEAPGVDLYLSSEEDVGTYNGMFDSLLSNTLSESESLAYLGKFRRATRSVRSVTQKPRREESP